MGPSAQHLWHREAKRCQSPATLARSVASLPVSPRGSLPQYQDRRRVVFPAAGIFVAHPPGRLLRAQAFPETRLEGKMRNRLLGDRGCASDRSRTDRLDHQCRRVDWCARACSKQAVLKREQPIVDQVGANRRM